MGASAAELPTDYTYTYTGQREAAEIGLKYYVARWYDSEIGHFLQSDTIIPQAGNPIGWNRYAYVNYNPLKYSDPSGHLANVVVGALIGGFVGGLTYAKTNLGESYNWGELALATGLGAGAGALIASGVGLAHAASAGSSFGSVMTGAGAAMIVANESYMFDNTNDFESDEFFFNGHISGVSGGITAIPGLGSGAIIATEPISSSCSYLIIDDDPTIQGVFWSDASGAIGGALNVTANQLFEWNTRHFDMKVHGILGEAYSAKIVTV